jgi:succinyl-CoA synthetase alpha subunit
MSRSGTLTYEVVDLLTRNGFGQSTCVGVGGDPIIGTTFVECLREFKNDRQTKAIVLCGEIGGSDEEDAAAFIAQHMPEMPVVAFIGGRNAPPGKSLGHAGAIISGNFGTPQSKIAAFQAAGVPVADRPSDIPALLKKSSVKEPTFS